MKIGLDRQGYDRLLASAAEKGHPILQINCFLDTAEGLLRKKRYGFRVREEKGGFILTVKGPRRDNGPLAVRREEESPIDRLLAERMVSKGIRAVALPEIPAVCHLREVCGDDWSGMEFVPVLTFRNERVRIVLVREEDRVEAELDRTEYADGRVYYEMEVEFGSEEEYGRMEPVLRQVFSSLDIPWKVSEKSKFARGMGKS